MGATNSKPQTVQMSNNSPFQISRDVLERVEKASYPEKATVCENCNRLNTASGAHAVSNESKSGSSEKITEANPYQHPVTIDSSWARRSTEIEETQFNKTLDRVHNLFGQPVKWAKANECSSDIDTMEQQLISCYRQYGTEPLKCAPLAKQYHTFVFKKQIAALKKTNSNGHNLKETDGK